MSDDINFPVEWQESAELPYEGLYFVAVRYPVGLGTYDFANWNGQSWELGYTAEVVGWVDISKVLDLIRAGWPQGDGEFSKKFESSYRPYDGTGEDEFVLVEPLK